MVSIEGLREGMAKVGVEFSLSEPTSLRWITLAEWVSSMKMMSTGLAAPDSRYPLLCVTTPSSDPLETWSGPCVGIQSPSSSGVLGYSMGILIAGRVRG
jgi:hypothetical protein